MPNWYYEPQELKLSPSILEGLDVEKEFEFRRKGARFIMQIGSSMGLIYTTVATGVVYFHRFYMFHSFQKFPKYVMACCCLFLAGKVEETPKKAKDIIKTAKSFLSELQFKEFRENPKEEMMIMEKILLKTIKFDFQVDHPYGYLLKYAKCLKGDKIELEKLVQMAWTFINDSLCTMLCLQWEPEIIAIALMHLAGKLSRFKVVDWTKREKSHSYWWDMYVEGITIDLLEGICHQLLDVYCLESSLSTASQEYDDKIEVTEKGSKRSLFCLSRDSQLSKAKHLKKISKTEREGKCPYKKEKLKLSSKDKLKSFKKTGYPIKENKTISGTSAVYSSETVLSDEFWKTLQQIQVTNITPKKGHTDITIQQNLLSTSLYNFKMSSLNLQDYALRPKLSSESCTIANVSLPGEFSRTQFNPRYLDPSLYPCSSQNVPTEQITFKRSHPHMPFPMLDNTVANESFSELLPRLKLFSSSEARSNLLRDEQHISHAQNLNQNSVMQSADIHCNFPQLSSFNTKTGQQIAYLSNLLSSGTSLPPNSVPESVSSTSENVQFYSQESSNFIPYKPVGRTLNVDSSKFSTGSSLFQAHPQEKFSGNLTDEHKFSNCTRGLLPTPSVKPSLSVPNNISQTTQSFLYPVEGHQHHFDCHSHYENESTMSGTDYDVPESSYFSHDDGRQVLSKFAMQKVDDPSDNFLNPSEFPHSYLENDLHFSENFSSRMSLTSRAGNDSVVYQEIPSNVFQDSSLTQQPYYQACSPKPVINNTSSITYPMEQIGDLQPEASLYYQRNSSFPDHKSPHLLPKYPSPQGLLPPPKMVDYPKSVPGCDSHFTDTSGCFIVDDPCNPVQYPELYSK